MRKISTPSPFFVLIVIVSTLCSLTASISITAATPAVMSVTPSYVLVGAQNNFTVSIILTNGEPFALFAATLNFNVTAVQALNGTIIPPWNGSQLDIDNDAGTVTIGGYNTVNPNQTLATIEFQALIYSNSTLHLTDAYLGQIPVTTEDAFVEIIGPINLTVASLRKWFYAGTNITIFGNATIEGSPINTLVGLELKGPTGTSTIRTVANGPDPLGDSWPINITELYPSDQYGNPTSSFANNTIAYFTIQIQNMASDELPWLIYIEVLDTHNTFIGQTNAGGIIEPDSTALLISGVYIPGKVYNGTATAYAEVFSDLPHNNGIPYCPEQNATFTITNGPKMTPPPVAYGNATFSSSFADVLNLSSDYSLGNYSVYATVEYKTFFAAANTTFFNTVACDFSGDGRCNSIDLGWLLRAWRPSVPYSLPDADLNHDGKVSSMDLGIFLRYFGKHV